MSISIFSCRSWQDACFRGHQKISRSSFSLNSTSLKHERVGFRCRIVRNANFYFSLDKAWAHANKDMQLKELYCALKGSSRCTPSRHGSRQPSERKTSPASSGRCTLFGSDWCQHSGSKGWHGDADALQIEAVNSVRIFTAEPHPKFQILGESSCDFSCSFGAIKPEK